MKGRPPGRVKTGPARRAGNTRLGRSNTGNGTHQKPLARGEGAAATRLPRTTVIASTASSRRDSTASSHSSTPPRRTGPGAIARAATASRMAVRAGHRQPERWRASTDETFDQTWLTECGGVHAAASRCFCYPDLARRRDRHPKISPGQAVCSRLPGGASPDERAAPPGGHITEARRVV